MSQNALATIDPNDMSGTELAAWLESFKANVYSGHRGPARPDYVVAGMTWAKTISSTAEELYYYDGAADILLGTFNPTDHTRLAMLLKSLDAGAAFGPDLLLDRASPSPQAADILAAVRWGMRNASNAQVIAAMDTAEIVTTTAAAEAARRLFQVMIAGALSTRMTLGQGLFLAGATGDDKGAGSVNAVKFCKNGADLTTPQTLTDAATIAWDTALGPIAKVTLGGNRTMGAPSNLAADCFYALMVIQDGTGGRTLAWNSVYKFAAATAPTITATAAKRDIFTFWSDGTNLYEVGRSQAL